VPSVNVTVYGVVAIWVPYSYFLYLCKINAGV
jgi:hypothetical protein